MLSEPLTINPERCVHQRITCSACDECVTVCPKQAWRMTDEGLDFDADPCDACGLCVAACPHEALSIVPPSTLTVGQMTMSASKKIGLALACECAPHHLPKTSQESSVQAPTGVTHCLHSMSPVWLFEHAQKTGSSDWYLLTGNCATCARAPKQTLHDRWQALASRFELMGTPLPVLHWCSLSEWADLMQLFASQQTADTGVRSLFKQLRPFFKSASEPVSEALTSQAMTSGRVAVTHLLKKATQQSPLVKADLVVPPLWSTSLNAAVCHWCMACLRVCPHAALCLSTSSDEKRGLFSIDNALCTGCGVCAEVCDVHALVVESIPKAPSSHTSQGPHSFPLYQHQCSHCNTKFWASRQPSAVSKGEASICPVCLKGKPRHHQRIIHPFDSVS